MKNNSKSTVGDREMQSLRLPGDYPWKVVGSLTDDLSQFLSPQDLDLITTIIRERNMEGILELGETWGLQCMPSMDVSLAAKRAYYQLGALLKKFRFATGRETRVALAKEKFLAGELQCGEFNREGWKHLSGAPDDWTSAVYTYARSFLEKLLGFEVPDLDVMTERSRHGPGATLDTSGGCVSSYHKFEKWPYQCTTAALGIARQLIYSDKRWLGALEDDYRTRFNIPKWVILDRQVFWESVFEPVDGNRITFVPKNARVERSIAIEPTMNLYLQLGVDGYIRRRLKRWGVDLDHQEKNQLLSKIGSLEGIDPYVTIDLANASNTVSVAICRTLLPRSWFNLLMKLRSPKGDLCGTEISYEMISSMGNGYTFALESALFTAIIYAVTKASGARVDSSEWAVFGDDLIIRRSLSDDLIRALTACGFEVNYSKSCFDNGVRESCGCDWFQGHPVRPVFLNETPKDIGELFTDLNRLKRILQLRWCLEETKTESRILRWVPEQFQVLKGPCSDTEFDSHIHVPAPSGKYRNGMWRYRRLVRRPRKEKGKNFLFRKLMHDLHPLPPLSNKWCGKLAGSGSRFSVYRRNADTLSITCSVASYWQSEYHEYQPETISVSRMMPV